MSTSIDDVATGGEATGGETRDTAGTRGIPFLRLVRVELRKLVDTRAGAALLWVIAGLTVVFMVATVAFSEGMPLPYSFALNAASAPLQFLLPVLGILAATSEFTRRTGLTTFTLEPRRVRVALAKMAATVVLGVGALLLAMAVAAIAVLVRGDQGPLPTWDLGGWTLAGQAAVHVLSLLMGVGLGLLLRSSALAIVVFFVAPMIVPMLELSQTLAPLVPWIWISDATAPLVSGQALTGEQWGHLATAVGLWVVLPLVAGTWLLDRREVK